MSEPYIGEIRMFAGNFAINGWAFCNGQLLSISGNRQFCSTLLGTTYGGDGQTTFALPDLRSRAPMHIGSESSYRRTGWLGIGDVDYRPIARPQPLGQRQ